MVRQTQKKKIFAIPLCFCLVSTLNLSSSVAAPTSHSTLTSGHSIPHIMYKHSRQLEKQYNPLLF
uniref:Hypothetical secreted peptide n=1 Tax=Glossina morsitans morsitans TaxID=37546 RepID=D3TSS8_GLOMM